MTTPQADHLFADVAGPKLNLGCGFDVRPAAAGWTNLDGNVARDGVVQHDLLSFPWPLQDAAFDLVYCSHVLEHIPPAVVVQGGRHRDVLFLVMEEIHRVLRPGGLLVLRVPWGYSQAGVIHIQHYRQWMPEWANYFEPEHEENLYSSARFRVESWKRTRGTESLRGKYWPRLGRDKVSATQHLDWRFPWLHKLLYQPSELEIRMRRL